MTEDVISKIHWYLSILPHRPARPGIRDVQLVQGKDAADTFENNLMILMGDINY